MEPVITIQGNVGTQPDQQTIGDTTKVSFRLGHTHSFRRNGGSWESAPTVWLTVECWRTLAQNVAESVRKGQPVIVVGRLRSQQWRTADGEQRSRLVIDAETVGHDLSRGRGMFNRPLPSGASADEAGNQELADGAPPGDGEPELRPDVPQDSVVSPPADHLEPSTIDDYFDELNVDPETGEVDAAH